MNRSTIEVAELKRLKNSKENRDLVHEVKQAKLEEESSINEEVTKEIQERLIMNINAECRQYRMNKCGLLYHINKEKEWLDRKKIDDEGENLSKRKRELEGDPWKGSAKESFTTLKSFKDFVNEKKFS